MILEMMFPVLLPLAARWAKREAQKIQLHGRVLSEAEMKLAKNVGVAFPEQVKVLEVPVIPGPDNILLRMAARHANMMGPNVAGIALDHSIYIRENHMSIRLLSHELRHVHQYEQFDSVDGFLALHLKQLLEYGYWNSPFEVDARRHEVERITSVAKNDENFCDN